MDDASRIDAGIDAGMDMVPDDCAQLSPAGSNVLAQYFAGVLLAIMPGIGCDRTCANIAANANDGIANITQMANAHARHDE